MGKKQFEYLITEQQRKNRKNWLIAGLANLVLYPILSYVFSAVFYGTAESLGVKFYEFLGFILVGMIPFVILWHCAYKNPGTKLLTWGLVLGAIRFIPESVKELKEVTDAWGLGVFVLGAAVYVWWYFFSLKLRADNVNIKAQKSAIQTLESTQP
jgi:hypothetical protein